MATIIECTESHYEAQKKTYGKTYVSYLECVMVECDFGERLVLTASEAACRCGADHTALVREEGRRMGERRVAEERDKYLRVEHHGWLAWIE